MSQPINPLGFIDLTEKKQSIFRIRQSLWNIVWGKLKIYVPVWAFLIVANYYYYKNWADPLVYQVLITVSTMIFLFMFIEVIQLCLEYNNIQKIITREEQKQQAEYLIKVAKSIGSRVFRFKSNDKKVIELKTELLGKLFKAFNVTNSDDDSFEVEVQF